MPHPYHQTRRALPTLLLAVLLAACGSPTPLHGPAASPTPAPPLATGGPQALATAPGPPLPFPPGTARTTVLSPPAPTVPPTLPPGGPTPGPAAFYARLTLTPTVPIPEFITWLHRTGAQPQVFYLRSPNPLGGAGAVDAGASDAGPEEVYRQLEAHGQGMNVSGALLYLDPAQYARLAADPRAHFDTGLSGPPAEGSAAVLARWVAATAPIRTVRAHQDLVGVGADGRPDPAVNPQGLTATDEIVELGPQHYGTRYRYTVQRTGGEVLELFDGHDAYRYDAAQGVVQHVPGGPPAWDDGLEAWPVATALFPGDAAFNIVGRTTLDGRAVIELVALGGGGTGGYVNGRTRVYLDATTFLPYRILNYSGPDPLTSPAVQRTITRLTINSPLTPTDFAPTWPPATRQVEGH